jgi:hypothetical protein
LEDICIPLMSISPLEGLDLPFSSLPTWSWSATTGRRLLPLTASAIIWDAFLLHWHFCMVALAAKLLFLPPLLDLLFSSCYHLCHSSRWDSKVDKVDHLREIFTCCSTRDSTGSCLPAAYKVSQTTCVYNQSRAWQGCLHPSWQSFMQMKDCVGTSHRSSAGWKWLQDLLVFTKTCNKSPM